MEQDREENCEALDFEPEIGLTFLRQMVSWVILKPTCWLKKKNNNKKQSTLGGAHIHICRPIRSVALGRITLWGCID